MRYNKISRALDFQYYKFDNQIKELVDSNKEMTRIIQKIYDKSKIKINDFVELTEDLGPFPKEHGWYAYNDVLKQGHIGTVTDINISTANGDNICEFVYDVQFPVVYYDSKTHYGVTVPEEKKCNFYSDVSYKIFYINGSKLKSLNNPMVRFFP